MDRLALSLALCVSTIASTRGASAQQPPPQPYPPQPYPPQPYPQPYYPQQPYPQPYYPQQPYPQPYPQQPYPQPPPEPQWAPPPGPKRLVSQREITEPIYGLVVGGILCLGAGYIIPLAAAGASGFNNSSEWLAIPVVGPFITMGEREWNDDNGAPGVGLALAAIFRIGGAAMFTAGVSIQETRVENVYAIAPLITEDAGGLSVSGSF